MTLTWKQGDRDPPLELTLRRDGEPYDLTDRSVRLVIGTTRGTVLVDTSPEVTDAVNGEIRYDWDAGDLDVRVRTYQVEVVVDEGTDAETTFPNDGYGEIKITKELGDE